MMRNNYFKRIVLMVLVGTVLCLGVLQLASTSAYAQATPQNSCGGGNSVDCLYKNYINPAIGVLSVATGMAVVVGIIWGGIQYSMSAGDSQKVTKAKQTITRSLVGLVAFLLLGSFLQFISPTDLKKIDSNSTTPSTGTNSALACSANAKFFGMKPWYAYLPAGSFYSDCTITENVAILPADGKKSVLPFVLLAVADDLLRVAAMVAVAFVITGGVKYMTSQGQPNETKMALSSIVNALIGLAVALFAAVIVSFVGGALIK